MHDSAVSIQHYYILAVFNAESLTQPSPHLGSVGFYKGLLDGKPYVRGRPFGFDLAGGA